MKECLDKPGVHLIDVPMDYSQNDRLLNEEIPERSRAIKAY
jgi:acetolactate synthase-1/2/3 large subunit